MCKPVAVKVGVDFAPFLKDGDWCYYYGNYTPGGFSASEYNSMVQNFKKDISRKERDDWYYRNNAVDKFALMLHYALKDRQCTIIPCATSKPRNSPNFNDRLDAVASKLGSLSLNYDIQFCLDTIEERTPSHTGGTRNPAEIIKNTRWATPTKTPNHIIILIDDVLTTGAHFRAYKDIILKNLPNSNVIGLFLARYDGSSIYGSRAFSIE